MLDDVVGGDVEVGEFEFDAPCSAEEVREPTNAADAEREDVLLALPRCAFTLEDANVPGEREPKCSAILRQCHEPRATPLT